MRLGVLDVGSNSAQLQVMDASAGGPPLPIYAVKEPTHLGELVGYDDVICEEGIQRAVRAVARALEAARNWEVDQLYAFATAAIRDAINRDDVVARVERVTGIRLQYLSGEEEARLTFSAVRQWYGWQAGRVLNIDIGGGSMELAFGRDANPDVAVSLPLGAGRVTKGFLGEVTVPDRGAVKALRKHVRRQVGEVADRIRWEGEPRRVIATSKTFKQLARLCGAPPQRKGPFVRRTLATVDLARCLPKLARTPIPERSRLRGISAARAPQILGGAVVAYETMRALRIEVAEVSPWALREGIILEHLAALTDTGTLPLQPLTAATSRAGARATVTALHRER